MVHRVPVSLDLALSGPPNFPGRAALRVVPMSIVAIAMPTAPFNLILPASVPFLTVLVSVSVLASIARMIMVMSVMPR